MKNQHTPYAPLSTADIHWKTDAEGHTVPTSRQFDDVYFSHTGGLAEARHVFINGNDLPHRWSLLDPRSCFVIAETGFGTGLNFLAACQLWDEIAPSTARLHFISTEKFPLTQSDLRQALSAWRDDPTLRPWIDRLIAQYPLPMSGCHRLHISPLITLDLWFGDASQSLDELIKTQQSARVDAWFLDGFAPAKNSDMWRDALFDQMAKLSHANTTLATFTAAGFVRRGLIAAGFDIIKTPGFGRKREMISSQHPPCQPTLSPSAHNALSKKIALIGGGISGVSLAFALKRRGHDIHLFEPDGLMSGASGNPCALFAPKLTVLEKAADHLPTVSFLYAHRHYQALNDAAKNSDQHVFEAIGVTDLLLPSQKSADKRRAMIHSYPKSLIHEALNDNHSADEQIHATHQDLSCADIVAHVPMGGILYPAKIAQAFNAARPATHISASVIHISESADKVSISTSDGQEQQTYDFDQVAICAGFVSSQIEQSLFDCRKIRGQVSWVALDSDQTDGAKHAIKYDGYCSQFYDDALRSQALLFGASFVRNSTDTTISEHEHQDNLHKLRTALPTYCDTLNISDHLKFYGRASIRAQTPDYHPIIGLIPGQKRSFCMYGMGSKGFSFAPLCAEILSELMDQGILPISKALLDNLSPNRPRLTVPLDQSK